MDYITKKGLKQLKIELEELGGKKRWEIAQWLREAASQGDLAENAEYMEAKEAQTALEEKIKILETRLRDAKVVSGRSRDIAEVGAEIRLVAASRKMKLKLVSLEEADAALGLVSTNSPIGKALLGKKVGEVIEVPTPKGLKKYKITKIV